MKFLDEDDFEITEIDPEGETPFEDIEFMVKIYNDSENNIFNVKITAEKDFSFRIFNEELLDEENIIVINIKDPSFIERVGWIELNYENINSERARIRDIHNNINAVMRIQLRPYFDQWITHVIPGLEIKLRSHDIEDKIINIGGCISPSYEMITFAHDVGGSPGEYVKDIIFPKLLPEEKKSFWVKIPEMSPYISSKINPHRFKIMAKDRHNRYIELKVLFEAISSVTCYCSAIILPDMDNPPWNTDI